MNRPTTKRNQPANTKTLLLATALVSLTELASAQFSVPQRLDTNSFPGTSESDGIALSSVGDTVHVAWFEQDALTGRNIYYARSFDAGSTWEVPRRIDQGPGSSDQEFPVLLAEGQTVALAWLDDRGTPLIQDVYARVSQNGGASFGPEIAATGFMTGDAGDADNLIGSISLPYIHLCFEDNVDATDAMGNFEDTIVVSSSNFGASFGAPVRVNHPPGGAGSADVDNPSLGSSGPRVHVAWVDSRNGAGDKVYTNTSFNGGLTFAGFDTRLDGSSSPSADANNPRMAVSGSDVIITWRDNRLNPQSPSKKLFMNASVNGGASFLGEARVDFSGAAANVKSGKIAISGERFVVAWVDSRNDPSGLLDDAFIRTGSLSGGTLTLNSEQRMDQTAPGTSDNGGVKVAYEGHAIYVMYQDSRRDPSNLNDALFLRASGNEGISFHDETPLTPSLTGAQDAEGDELVVNSFGEVTCVWSDDRNGSGALPPNDVFASSGKPLGIVVTPSRRRRVQSPQAPRDPL